MKKLAFILLLLLPTLLIAQGPKGKFWDNWAININGGQTWFLGDVSKNFDQFEPSLRETSTAAGIILSKTLSCVFGLRGQLYYGNLFGQKDKYAGGAPANLKFNAIFWNYNINATIDFTALIGKCNPDRKFSFYGILGAGFTDFKTRLYNSVTGKEINTWGYDRPSGGTYYWVTELTMPVGLGMSYKLGKKLKITLESTLNEVNTEKIDRVVGMSKRDAYYYTAIGITYNLSKWNRACECKPLDVIHDTIRIERTTHDTVWIKENTYQFNELKSQIDSLKNLMITYLSKPPIDTTSKKVNKDIDLGNIIDNVIGEVKDTIERTGYLLYSVYFDINKWNIKPAERVKVAAVAETLNKNPKLNVKIIGHADRQGGYNYNIWLSKQRAESVAKTLTRDYKINPKRYTIDWRGYIEPLSQKYYYINRRVDFLKVNP